MWPIVARGRDQELCIIPGSALFRRSAVAISACALLALAGCGNANQGSPASSKPVFPIYTDAGATTNHYTPSGYMGDIGDIHINDAYKEVVHSGETTSIRVTYTARGSGPNECSYPPPCMWAGVYWLEPANNWGTDAVWAKSGYDLSGYHSLLFWAKADEPTTIDFQVGGIDNEYGDSLKDPLIISAKLDSHWREYRIDLDGADLSHIIGGFAWVTNWDTNPNGCTFYLDDIRFE